MATPQDMAAAMKEHSLADVIRDIGYAFTASVEECKNNMLNFGPRELTAGDVARTITIMIQYQANSTDGPQIQTPGNFWNHEKKDSVLYGMGEWNAEVFVQTLKELASNLNWKEVILKLDHQEFLVPDRVALSLLFSILRLGLQSAGYPTNLFPIDYLCRPWTNLNGQMSMISNILKHPDIFSFTDYPVHQVPIDILKSPPEPDNKEVGTWRILYLVELLLYASEKGFYSLVTELFKIPLQRCPDVLLIVLLQINPPLTTVRQELLTTLTLIFLGNHPNSGILHCAWHAQNFNVKPIIMHAMADWYLHSECDQSRLSRILDVAQDLKALSLLLNMQSFPFAIDLACLASRREYLKLDKWLADKTRDHGESFVAAVVKFLQTRCQIVLSHEQLPKAMQLPHETIATMLTCLQMCIPNVQQELQESIYNVTAKCQALVLRKARPARILETPFDPASPGAQFFTPHSDPIASLTPKIANIRLGGLANTGTFGPPNSSTFGAPNSGTFSSPNKGTFGPLATAPGSPSGLIGATTNSPFAMMPMQHNPNMPNIGVLPGMAPALPRLQDSADPTSNNVTTDIETEVNGYFQKIYNHPSHSNQSIDEVLDMLKKFQESPNKRDRDVFSCMLKHLFEEYKFFPEYPDKELLITAQIFGGIIERGLVPSYVSLGLALRFVLDALKKDDSKIYYFGLAALDRFKSRLKDYHSYCEHVRAIPNFNKFPPHLIEYVSYGMQSQEPPMKPQGPVLPASLAAVLNQNPVVNVTSSYRSIVSTPSISVMSEITTTGSAVGRPSIAKVTNIETLLTATKDLEKVTKPPEAIQDKTYFIFNNLSQLNLQVKCEELKEIVSKEYFPWLSRYLVMNRVSIEANFHTLYSNLLDVLKVQEINKLVKKETYRNIKVLLRSKKRTFADRALLKNLGHWLGMLTLGRNLPILHLDIDLKAMLLEAHQKSRQELLNVVPFVAKVLEACAKSVAFKPPNPWTMALMNVLAELHEEPNLELNLKFEVEVLCRNLSLDIKDLKPTYYLRDPESLRTIKLQLGSQPQNEQQEAVVAGALAAGMPMPISQAMVHQMQMMPPSTQTMQPDEPTPTDLGPSDPALMVELSHQEPRFNYLDVSITSGGFAQKIFYNPQIHLLQNFPHLKQFVKPAIDRSIQEWIHPVVDRAIKYALTTCEHVIRKDFALDPDAMRMRMCAHHMMRNLTAGIAMVTCREQIITTLSSNLKNSFTLALMPSTQHTDAIEEASIVVATDNMELACIFIQKTAVEKALPELDKHLLSDFEIRKQAYEEGRRYYDANQLNYQREMIPERCRLRVGGPTARQLSVYEEFACNIPGFAPIGDPNLLAPKPLVQEAQMPHLTYNQAMNMPQVSTDEMGSLITVAEMFLTNSIGNASKAMLAVNMHSLLECLYMARRTRDIMSGCNLLQKAVEGLLDAARAAGNADPLDLTRYRDIHLRVLKLLENPRVYGHTWTSKQVTCCLTECREEIRYNIEVVDCLIRNHLVNMPQYDIALAHMMDNGNNYVAVTFAMQLVQLYLADDGNNLVTESELQHTTDMIARIVSHRQPHDLNSLMESVRLSTGQDPSAYLEQKLLLGPTAHLHAGIKNVMSQNHDDPPDLKERTDIFIREWTMILQSPITELNLRLNFSLYMLRLNMNGILKSDDMTTRFLRIATRICIDNVYRALAEDGASPNKATAGRERYYNMCDPLVKLISLLIKNMPDGGNPTPKLNLLNKVLGIIAGWMIRDQKDLFTGFHQLPYHRLLSILLLDMIEPDMEPIGYQAMAAFCNMLHIVRPTKVPGFVFSWVGMIAQRDLIRRILADSQKGWSMYSTLLIDIFEFLSPFIGNYDVALCVMELYQGILRVLLVMLHDFPEFLCDYHNRFCDVIPANCIQLKNLILSAYPRSMRLPDPFTPTLKVDLLEEITLPPRSAVNYATLLPNSQFKKDLDVYLKDRAPVTFLSELRTNMQAQGQNAGQYNIPLINAVVLYVGAQAIASIRARGEAPSISTIAPSAHMDIFQNFTVDFDYEGRYIFFNALSNQLRYPNRHSYYFSCVLLHLFAETHLEVVQVQITRVILERLIVNRPHPWGLLVTFIDLIKNPAHKFWQRRFVHSSTVDEFNVQLPPLYNYIVDQVICRISGRKTTGANAQKDNPENNS